MKLWDDSSAVVPLLVEEADRDPLLCLLEADGGLVVWWGTPVECVSAVARREREGALDAVATGEVLARLHELERAWVEVSLSPAVRSLAQRLLGVHDLRAADALQLFAALVATEHDPPSLGFRLSGCPARDGRAA